MSEIQWTENQKTAIEADNADILVSASAGSGKSTIMVERIIRKLTDADDPIDISKMCIVTFTNAATLSLIEKLKNALTKKIEENPKSKFLRSQLASLSNATITTINAFCYSLVRENFSTLGISPTVRIADESEEGNLEYKIMGEVIEDFYSGNCDGICDFADFCGNYADLKDDSLENIFLSLYHKLSSCVEGIEILLENAQELEDIANGGEFFESRWGRVIKIQTVNLLNGILNSDWIEINSLTENGDLAEKYKNKLADISVNAKNIDAVLDDGYKTVKQNTNFTLSSLGRKGERDEELDYFIDYCSDIFKKIKELYDYEPDEIIFFAKKYAENSRDLHCFLSEFSKRLSDEKSKRGIISFNDCERLSMNLLCCDGEPTDIALNYRERFAEVYIDEYQDVNPMQDLIFNMISRPNGKFIVGDIKQSIYLFRGAAPGLFENYRNEYKDYNKDEIQNGKQNKCRIFLSENFRSSENILSFANLVSRVLFVCGQSQIEYYEGDSLVYKKTSQEKYDDLPVRMNFFDSSKEQSLEACYIADEIDKLVDSGEKLRDICILVRNKGHFEEIGEELKKRSVPFSIKSRKNFFTLPEIELVTCFLYAIDNPMLDLYLCGIMKSPIYNFSINEIHKIKKEFPNEVLYDSVLKYAKEHENRKLTDFISELEELRKFARRNSVDKLLWKLYYEKKVFSCLCNKEKDKGRKNNLLLFYDYSRNFESGDFNGLYDFLRYIEDLNASSTQSVEISSLDDSADAVQVMTIHSSKGLEFKYCFLCGMGKKFNTDKDKIVFNPKLGAFGRISGSNNYTSYDTVFLKAVQALNKYESRDEEIRLLYVALTRAQSALWITGTISGNESIEKFRWKCRNGKNYISRYTIDYAPSYSQWLWTVAEAYGGYDFFMNTYTDIYSSPDKAYIKEETGNAVNDGDIDTKVLENCAYVYPSDKIGKIPAKLSVSRLYPDVLDDYSADINNLKPNEKIPSFVFVNQKPDSAERGTATHIFMQFCDFDNVDNNGVEDEIAKMIEKGFYTKEDALLVYIDELKSFFDGQLYKNMRNSTEIYREKRFNVNLPASDFTEDNKDIMKDEQVLVQGVIDCFYYDENGKIVLVDYKTDRVPDDKETAAALLRKRHSRQIGYYKKALEIITGDKVSSALIYSFGMGGTVEI